MSLDVKMFEVMCKNSAMRKAAMLCLFIFASLPLRADDGAASIGAGGIVLMKREPRIVMAKEVLNISDSKVIVAYDFRNDSGENITTEVAFPIPAYGYEDAVDKSGKVGFDDFRLTVDGAERKFVTETRALVGQRDVTAILAREHIDAATFGHMSAHAMYDGPFPDIDHAGSAVRRRLTAAGMIKNNNPNWKVHKKYYWSQTFPAHSTVHIRHEYTPVLGNSNTIGDPKDFHDRPADEEYASVCPDLALQNTLAKIWNRPRGIGDVSPLWITYVDFILTTGNTWKTPIEDFTLNVERPHNPKYVSYVSFCWDDPVTKIDADHYTAHVNGLIPKKELRIGYIMGEAKTK